jgi:bifunctional pyridoxal-dependent enzyme with beta-cystathionase and maltose regulon repressor activities
MRQLEDLLAPTDILLISDEVYEHMVFDGAQHQSAARFPAWRRAPSSSPASARPTTSPAGRSAPWPRRPP